jgi:hypothetical protein
MKLYWPFLMNPAIVGAALLALVFLLICIRRVKKAAAALKEREKKPYTYKDFLRDLESGNVPMSEIVGRCKDAAVPYEELPPELKPPVVEPPPTPADKLLKSRLEWFEKASGGLARPIVPPPPPKVIAIPGYTILCGWCAHKMIGFGHYLNPSRGFGSHVEKRLRNDCEHCKGTGFVVIQGK